MTAAKAVQEGRQAQDGMHHRKKALQGGRECRKVGGIGKKRARAGR
jgi:hypothetical protein